MDSNSKDALFTVLTEQNQLLQKTVDSLSAQLDKMQLHIHKLERLIFGQKSEKLPKKEVPTKNLSYKQFKERIQSKNEKLEPDENAASRKALPDELERNKIKYDIPEDERYCHCCDMKLHCVGKDISEQLDFVPSKLCVLQHIRYKYGCRTCKSIFVAKLPERTIEKYLQ